MSLLHAYATVHLTAVFPIHKAAEDPPGNFLFLMRTCLHRGNLNFAKGLRSTRVSVQNIVALIDYTDLISALTNHQILAILIYQISQLIAEGAIV